MTDTQLSSESNEVSLWMLESLLLSDPVSRASHNSLNRHDLKLFTMDLRAKFKQIKLKIIAEFKYLKCNFVLNLSSTCTTIKCQYISEFKMIFRAVFGFKLIFQTKYQALNSFYVQNTKIYNGFRGRFKEVTLVFCTHYQTYTHLCS